VVTRAANRKDSEWYIVVHGDEGDIVDDDVGFEAWNKFIGFSGGVGSLPEAGASCRSDVDPTIVSL